MSNNAKVAGILNIVSGAFGVLWLVGAIFLILFMRTLIGQTSPMYGQQDAEILKWMTLIYGIGGLIGLLIGVLGIVGGIFALKRKYWGLALAGAIAGTITFFPTGIPAIIYAAMAKPEFGRKPAEAPPLVATPPVDTTPKPPTS